MTGKQCEKNGYRPSYSKEDARRKCSSDNSCYGVYDNFCDDRPPFFLCPKLNEDPFVLEESTVNPVSCVHVKEGYRHNHKLYFSFISILYNMVRN